MKEDGKKRNLVDLAVEAFDLPGEVLAGLPKLTVVGNRRVYVECHKGILEYDTSRIVINGGQVLVKLQGSELEICAMNAEEMLIRGFLTGIEYE